MVEIQCERCPRSFEMSHGQIEEYKQAEKPFLCPDCEAKELEAHPVVEPKRRFEYKVVYVADYPMRPDVAAIEWRSKIGELNGLGSEGWEAVTVIFRSHILLKREYFE